jgi:hypothetical protein
VGDRPFIEIPSFLTEIGGVTAILCFRQTKYFLSNIVMGFVRVMQLAGR